jgi:hypothetical protein
MNHQALQNNLLNDAVAGCAGDLGNQRNLLSRKRIQQR